MILSNEEDFSPVLHEQDWGHNIRQKSLAKGQLHPSDVFLLC